MVKNDAILLPSVIKGREVLIKDRIDFGKVIAIETYSKDRRTYIKNLVKCLLYKFDIVFDGQCSEKLFFYSLSYANRKDYDEIRDLFIKYNREYKLVDVQRKKSFKGIFRKSVKIIGKTIQYKYKSIQSPFLIAILYVEHRELYKQYLKYIPWNKVKIVGTFCDAHCTDNLVAQLAIINNIKTFTLQHGQYRILRPGFENADVESYKNFISDRLLAWGEATKDEFMKYGIDAKRVVPVGALKSFSFNKPMENIVDNDVFGVIMCGDTYISSNVGMIKVANEIAKKLNMRYFVRFHPRNDLSIYKPYIEKSLLEGQFSSIGNEEYANKVTFSLVHMTGVFVEMLSINSPIFVFDDDYLEDIFRIKEFCFRTSEDFEKIYNNYIGNVKSLKERQYSYYNYYNNSERLKDNYHDALKALENI